MPKDIFDVSSKAAKKLKIILKGELTLIGTTLKTYIMGIAQFITKRISPFRDDVTRHLALEFREKLPIPIEERLIAEQDLVNRFQSIYKMKHMVEKNS